MRDTSLKKRLHAFISLLEATRGAYFDYRSLTAITRSPSHTLSSQNPPSAPILPITHTMNIGGGGEPPEFQSVSMGKLYGVVDFTSKDWRGGILSGLSRVRDIPSSRYFLFLSRGTVQAARLSSDALSDLLIE